MRTFWLIVYYVFARHLPKSTMPVLGRMAYRLRYRCAKHLFAECGTSVNVEQGAYIGNGKHFRVGNNIGIGKDFCSHNRPLLIQDRLLMGENVPFLGGHTPSQIRIHLSVLHPKRIRRRHWRYVAMCG